MKLLTKEIIKKFETHPLHSQDEKGFDAEVLVKYFNPLAHNRSRTTIKWRLEIVWVLLHTGMGMGVSYAFRTPEYTSALWIIY